VNSIAFGNVGVGTSSAVVALTATNQGSQPFTLALSVAGTSEFHWTTGTCLSLSTLAAGAACTLQVRFDPTSAGSKSATLNFGGGSSQAVPLSGTGVALSSQDVGAVAATGNFSQSGSTLTVGGSGADIFGTADEFRYVFQNITGNATITARVVSLQNTQAFAKAGVMIRSSTSAGSINVAAVVTPTPSNLYRFQARTSTGGSTLTLASGGSGALGVWLRIVRSGNTFTAFSSADGTSFTQLSSTTITMPSAITAGIAVTSHLDGTVATATFDNVSITQP
jgi:regulation of enolase protein 1 (concanavalin A-like superfamily)